MKITKNPLIILKKTLLVILAFSPVFSFAGLRTLAYLATPAPFGVVMVNFSGCDPATEAILTWNQDVESNVSIWLAAGTPRDVEEGSVTLAPLPAANYTVARNGTITRAKIHGLQPGTNYAYKVSVNGPVFGFKSAPASNNESFHALLVSDTQFYYFNGFYDRVAKKIGEDDSAAFLLVAGDIVDEGSMIQGWNHFMDASRPWMDHIPLVPVPGNHDEIRDDDTWYWAFLGVPTADSVGPRSYYSFNWSNVQFVMVELANGDQENMSSPAQQEQLAWLNATLARGMDKDFRVVMFHRDVFSAEEDRIVNPTVVQTLVPTMEKYNVSLVLYGHKHQYNRFSYNGTTYLCHAQGGGMIDHASYVPTDDELDAILPGLRLHRVSLVPAVTRLEFAGKELRIVSTSVDGVVFDDVTLEVNAPGSKTTIKTTVITSMDAGINTAGNRIDPVEGGA